MNAYRVFPIAAVFLAAGCASVYREIPLTTATEGPAFGAETIPIRLSRVGVADGGLFGSAIYWKPSAWRSLALPVGEFQGKVKTLVRHELDQAGFGADPAYDYALEVEVEKLALFTRGEEQEGYRQGYARLRFTLKSPGKEILRCVREGEARFAGSGVKTSAGGSLFRKTYVYERKDPEPMDYAVRLAVRAFLDDLRPLLPLQE